MSSATITQAGGAATSVYGGFILLYANRAAGSQTPKVVDIKTVQQIQVHSNIAGRTFVKRGYNANGGFEINAALRPLTNTDILFSFNVGVDMGSTFNFEPSSPEIYTQEVQNNFDEFRVYLTDNKGQTMKFINQAEITFTFAINRQYIVPNSEDRIKNLMNYNSYQH
jgi:hypothetical protein